MKDLTLAICMYNAGRYIEETLQCIVAQTMQDFHLLIVNDCSTDSSAEKVRGFFDRNPRQYELVNFEMNVGLCAGRRFVEEHATTKYITFVDADDCPYPELVERLYAKIASDDDLMAVGCHLEYMDSDGRKIPGGIFLGAKTKEEFRLKAEKGKLIFMQPTAIYDRELALRVGGHCVEGFPEGRPRYRDLCEDLDLWCRMSDLYVEGKAIVVVPEVLCRYRKHPTAMSANSIGMILRMRHIKANLRRRRAGMREQTFIEFRDSLTEKELKELKREAKAADSLRNGAFLLRRGSVFKGVATLAVSVWNRPGYVWEKIRHNLLHCALPLRGRERLTKGRQLIAIGFI